MKYVDLIIKVLENDLKVKSFTEHLKKFKALDEREDSEDRSLQ